MELVPHSEIEVSKKHREPVFLVGSIAVCAALLLLLGQFFPVREIGEQRNNIRILSAQEIERARIERAREMAALLESNSYPSDLPVELIFAPESKAKVTIGKSSRDVEYIFNKPINDTIDIYSASLKGLGWAVDEKLSEARMEVAKNGFIADIDFAPTGTGGTKVKISYATQ